jgi:VIT1/CCC1 family predicted Fe2+/Mn2+ transporter
MVLGLNDALVELSGTLAGLTFAFQDTRLISLSGLITGIAATLSMAASEYLSSKADGQANAFKSSLYTGGAYIVTVILLVLPYLLIENPFIALAIMISAVVMIIFVFNLYIAVAKNLNFKKRFLQMAAISLGVAGLSFLIGIGIDKILGVTV